MGIDPKSLAAFAGPNQGIRKEPDPVPGEEEAERSGETDLDDLDLGAQYADLLPLLEEHHEEIGELADELGSDAVSMLDEPIEDSEKDTLAEGFNTLDRKLQKALMLSCKEISLENCVRIAEHLESEGMVADADRVSGWLFRLGEWLGENGD